MRKVANVPALVEKLTAPDADPIAIARESGFEFSSNEWMSYRNSMLASLSDAELETIAGGDGQDTGAVCSLEGGICDQMFSRSPYHCASTSLEECF